jgi:hypothetical protein
MHPLTPNLAEMSDNDLNDRFRDLSNKLSSAYRMGSTDMVNQIQMLMEDYQAEIMKRQQKAYEDLVGKGNMFDGIIKVK